MYYFVTKGWIQWTMTFYQGTPRSILKRLLNTFIHTARSFDKVITQQKLLIKITYLGI